jgi:hypothetical protein
LSALSLRRLIRQRQISLPICFLASLLTARKNVTKTRLAWSWPDGLAQRVTQEVKRLMLGPKRNSESSSRWLCRIVDKGAFVFRCFSARDGMGLIHSRRSASS